jgi:hypothetical protein
MKSNFNGASTLSKIVQITSEQQDINSRNQNFLEQAEQRFGQGLSSVTPQAGYGLK